MYALSMKHIWGKSTRFLLKGGMLALLALTNSPNAQAAAPARTNAPYAESICSSNSDVFFCEDFEGAADSIMIHGVQNTSNTWKNPAIEFTDVYWSSGGTRQLSTAQLPGFDSTKNRVWRIAKGPQTFTDIVTGKNPGTGDGGLQGRLNAGLAGSGETDFYVRLQGWWSADHLWPAEIDFKQFVGLPRSGWNTPTDAWWSADFGFWQDYWCSTGSGYTNFNDVPMVRYSKGGTNTTIFPAANTYCPTLSPGTSPNGTNAPRIQRERWYTFEMHWVLSQDTAVARIELWVDGVKAYDSRGSGIRTCATGGPCTGMGYIILLAYMNRVDPQRGYYEVDNIVMSRKYIGLPGNSVPPVQPPTTPTGVSVNP
ncbi:MAG: hypothetical protein HOP18_21805 [Deltaproteobacteria bacterium]|nr:hypothetical protein [Deltaproteobacteria bacterium]